MTLWLPLFAKGDGLEVELPFTEMDFGSLSVIEN